MQAKLVKDHGWKCTAAVVLNVVLRAAARSISISAACRDLAVRPSDQAVMTALEEGLPKTLSVLERRLNEALTGPLPRRRKRRAVASGDRLAFDAVLRTVSAKPQRAVLRQAPPGDEAVSRLRLGLHCRVRPTVHAGSLVGSAARIDSHGAPAVAGQNPPIGPENQVCLVRSGVFQRVGRGVPASGASAVLDARDDSRAQTQEGPPGHGVALDQAAGRGLVPAYHEKRQTPATVSVCVGYRTHKNRKDGKQVKQKLLFAAWRVKGSPTEIRECYRKRFGIEASFRQLRQARIYTCTRHPRLRSAVRRRRAGAAQPVGLDPPHLTCRRLPRQPDAPFERLRFKRMLDWIVHEVKHLYHDGSTPCIEWKL